MTEQDTDQLAAEVAHWRAACEALADLDAIAAPAAWASLEDYLRLRVRQRLTATVADLTQEAAAAARALATGADQEDVRARVLRLRRKYLQVETILDFYGDAVASRTNPALAAVLRGLDVIAGDSLDLILHGLGIATPPAVVYLDKGLGAAILRADVRLWDGTSPSPVAAVKITRHNLSHPTALLHETGHQVAHLTGWTPELKDALERKLRHHSQELAAMWCDWASEIAADVHAFAQAGFAPLPALANVVDGTTKAVHRIVPGDPHPPPWIRVMFNVALCRSWYGPGPWDAIAQAWSRRHQVDVRTDAGALAQRSMQAMNDIVDICTRQPMAAFRGQPLAALADPNRVSPTALEALARRAGGSLLTSQYLARREPLAILAWLTSRPMFDTTNAAAHRQALQGWLASLSPERVPKVA